MQMTGVSLRDVYCRAADAISGGQSCEPQEYCSDDFSEGDSNWDSRKGDWQVKDGQMCISGNGVTLNTCTMGKNDKDYIVRVDDANLTSGKGYGIIFRAEESKKKRFNGYSFQYDPGYRGGAFVFRKWVNGRELKPIAEKRDRNFDWHNKSHDVEVVIQGDTFTAFIDGEAVLSVTDSTYTEGGVGLRSWDASQVCFDRFALSSIP